MAESVEADLVVLRGGTCDGKYALLPRDRSRPTISAEEIFLGEVRVFDKPPSGKSAAYLAWVAERGTYL